MSIKRLLLIAALVASNAVNAAPDSSQWVPIIENRLGSIYIFPDSIATDELGHKLIWTKTVITKPKDSAKKFKALYVFDCDAKKEGVSHFIKYDVDDNIIKETSASSILVEFNTVDPDGFSYNLMQSMCR